MGDEGSSAAARDESSEGGKAACGGLLTRLRLMEGFAGPVFLVVPGCDCGAGSGAAGVGCEPGSGKRRATKAAAGSRSSQRMGAALALSDVSATRG